MEVFAVSLAAAALGGCGSDPSESSPSMTAVATGSQVGAAGEPLQPYRVKLTDRMLNPAAGVTVIWSVVAGGGSVDPATSLTDDDGTAETTATLGTALGTQEVIATAPGFPESPVSFLATIIAGPPHDIVKIDGDGQSGVPGSVLAVPLSVRVADQYDNPVEGQFVSWSVVQGGGTLSQSKTRTNSKGETSTTYSLGLVGGVNTIAAAANSAGAVSFTETGSAP